MADSITDVMVLDHGSVILFRPETDAAKTWIQENVSADSQWFGGALAVERRYAIALYDGMVNGGLDVNAY